MTIETVRTQEVHFGPREIQHIPLNKIVVLEQVRKTYDKSALDELADSMVVDPDVDKRSAVESETFNLHNPVEVAELDYMAAVAFLEDYAEHYKIPQDERVAAHQLFLEGSDTAYVLYAGHRRRLAVMQLVDRFEIDPQATTIAATVSKNISFATALQRQLTENIHERPPVEEEARAIGLYYDDLCRQAGQKISIRLLREQLVLARQKSAMR